MKKTALFISTLLMVSMAAAQPSNVGGNPFNGFVEDVDNFVESLEVRIAGMVGGPELKSKALANNANESLREAKELSDQNRSEEATQRIEKYNRQMNRSLEAAGQANSSKLDSQLSNVSRKNVEVLEKVRDKVPEQAKQGIQKAIDNAEKARGKPVMEDPGRDGDERGKPSEPGKPNISEKIDERAENSEAGEVREKINRTVEKGRETVKRKAGVPENVSTNISEGIDKAAENISGRTDISNRNESKPEDKSSGEKGGKNESIVEKGYDAEGDPVDETTGEGSGNSGVGLP